MSRLAETLPSRVSLQGPTRLVDEMGPPMRVRNTAATIAVLALTVGACSGGDAAPATPTVTITSGPSEVRQGDVVRYRAEVRDEEGKLAEDVMIAWSVQPPSAGLFTEDGSFVGYVPGSAQVLATALGLRDTLTVAISERGLSGSFAVVGHGEVSTYNSAHIFVNGDVAYTGTMDCYRRCGDRLFVWDVSDPAQPTITDEVVVGGSRVNDVMVRTDGTLAAITNEGGDGGIILLDLSDPARPAEIARLTDGLEGGTHNVWIEDDIMYVFVEAYRSPDRSRLHVVDISDPADPTIVSTYYAGSSNAHDVYVRDGLAFLSHRDAGLIILDVGVNGSPSSPVELGRGLVDGSPISTHSAWYWPDTGYVFVGEEPQIDCGPDRPGTMYVFDVRDATQAQVVATYDLPGPGFPPHSFWLDEQRGILYVAWEGHGIRAIDVTGSLIGQLERQGREIANIDYADAGKCLRDSLSRAMSSYSLQLYDGLLYVSDYTSGLWILQPDFAG